VGVVRVEVGDITTYRGDAIVNAANNHLNLGAGVAGAIRRAGGPSIQAECDRHGPIRVGEAALTGAGNLQVDFIIHAAAMGDEPVSGQSIRASTLASLDLAERHGIRRLAFPVLGSGVGGFDFVRAAVVMADAIRESPHSDAIHEIVFFAFQHERKADLEHVLRKSNVAFQVRR